MADRRVCLLVATDRYRDTNLDALNAPSADVDQLESALGNGEVGAFEVQKLVNQPHYAVARALETIFKEARRDDLLLLYFSGHGLKDEEGQLYLAMNDTERGYLGSTAVAASWVSRIMERSRSRRQVLMLDCCYGGAFIQGMKGDDQAVHTLERFQGTGRVVLTASDATQFAFDGDRRDGDASPSVFTKHLVNGLVTGEADRDGDGDIAVGELYDYVFERVVDETPHQRPEISQMGCEGRLLIARNTNWTLPDSIRSLIDHPLSEARVAAVPALTRLLSADNPRVRDGAVDELRMLAGNDSRRVSEAAGLALAEYELGSHPPANDHPPAVIDEGPVEPPVIEEQPPTVPPPPPVIEEQPPTVPPPPPVIEEQPPTVPPPPPVIEEQPPTVPPPPPTVEPPPPVIEEKPPVVVEPPPPPSPPPVVRPALVGLAAIAGILAVAMVVTDIVMLLYTDEWGAPKWQYLAMGIVIAITVRQGAWLRLARRGPGNLLAIAASALVGLVAVVLIWSWNADEWGPEMNFVTFTPDGCAFALVLIACGAIDLALALRGERTAADVVVFGLSVLAAVVLLALMMDMWSVVRDYVSGAVDEIPRTKVLIVFWVGFGGVAAAEIARLIHLRRWTSAHRDAGAKGR